MKNQIVVIGGGDSFSDYKDYLNSLNSWEFELDSINKSDWKSTLDKELEEKYQIIRPKMPNSQNARYKEWRIIFSKIIPLLNNDIVLIGHSLGGLFLAKYLSENVINKKILATFLLAAPFCTDKSNPLTDFNLELPLAKFSKQSEKIFILHSKDDSVVSLDNAYKYNKTLENSILKIFKNEGHFNSENFPELVKQLKNLTK